MTAKTNEPSTAPAWVSLTLGLAILAIAAVLTVMGGA